MPDILDQIQQQQTAEENASLEGAQADVNWANTFANTPSVDKLRAARNLTDQVNAAVQRRQELAAQTDRNAQAILLNQKRFENEQALQPLKVAHIQSQVDHENALKTAVGAHQIYTQKRDAENLNDSAAYHAELSQMDNAPGDDGYEQEWREVASRHPYALSTPEGERTFTTGLAAHYKVNEIKAALPDTTNFYETIDEAKKANPDAVSFRQHPKTGFFYVHNATIKKSEPAVPQRISDHYDALNVSEAGTVAEMNDLPEGDADKKKLAAKLSGIRAQKAFREKQYPALKAPTQAPPATVSPPNNALQVGGVSIGAPSATGEAPAIAPQAAANAPVSAQTLPWDETMQGHVNDIFEKAQALPSGKAAAGLSTVAKQLQTMGHDPNQYGLGGYVDQS